MYNFCRWQECADPGWWRAGDGRFLMFSQMTDAHLENALSLIERNLPDSEERARRFPKYIELLDEQGRREKNAVFYGALSGLWCAAPTGAPIKCGFDYARRDPNVMFVQAGRRGGKVNAMQNSIARQKELIDARREGWVARATRSLDLVSYPLASQVRAEAAREAERLYPYPKLRVPNVQTDSCGTSWRVVNGVLQSCPTSEKARNLARRTGESPFWRDRELAAWWGEGENTDWRPDDVFDGGDVGFGSEGDDTVTRLRCIANVLETPEIEVDA